MTGSTARDSNFDSSRSARAGRGSMKMSHEIAATAHMNDHCNAITDLPAEQRAIRSRCFHPSGTFVEFGKDAVEQSIPERFERQVANYPDRLAVRTRNHTFTYRALNETANQIAHAILACRDRKGEAIALLLGRPMHRIAAMLGVLKAGKFYVPIDHSLPHARIRSLVDDSRTKLLLTDSQGLALAKDLEVQSVNLDQMDDGLSDDNLGLRIPADSLAYIIYTSGSTGQPKGVCHTHRSLLHSIMTDTNNLHICSEDRLLLLPAPGMRDLFRGLLNGAGVFPFSLKGEGFGTLADWLIGEQITIYHSVPTIFRHFVSALTDNPRFPALRLILLGGEPIFCSDVEIYKKNFSPSCFLVNNFSGTEAPSCRYYFIDKQTENRNRIVPVGYPVNDKEILLLDDCGEEVDLNEIGEIAVKSAYLSPGYWRMPDLTQAVFLPDSEGGDKRIYYTGDLGRMQPDGCLELLGRKDLQVKIRGYRVEIAEIESALLKHSQVKESVVVAMENHAGDLQLVAYVVLAEQAVVTVGELQSYLKQKLPDYMVPSAFVELEALPLTPNGKVDRGALPKPSREHRELEERYQAPRTEVESIMAAIWSEMLGVEHVGTEDNFFDLGGSSLLASKLFVRLREEFQIDLPLRLLFESPTLASISAQVEAERKVRACREPKPAPRWSYLIELQAGQNRSPIFCFPGGTGGEFLQFVLARLMRQVGKEYPCYALKPRSAEGREPAHARLEDMAADYLREIMSVQAQGPYHLVGHCLGGVVAYEVARQLQALGHKVGLLALLDADRPTTLKRVKRWAKQKYFFIRLEFHWSRLRGLDWRNRLSYLFVMAGRIIAAPWRSLKGKFVDGQDHLSPGDRLPPSIQRTYPETIHRSKPRRYQGRITLLASEAYFQNDPTLGWRGLAAAGIEMHKLPGGHAAMVLEHFRLTAQVLKACIEKAARETESGVEPSLSSPALKIAFSP